ncbi:MAG: ketoacyl-ACP synthase III [Bryobacter sp.]
MFNAKISALGVYVPPQLLTNQDLERLVDTTDEWILTRTGIRERHIAAPDQASSDLGFEAAKRCLAARGIAAKDLDAILVATVTPDKFFPSTACLIQERLGATGAWGFDISAACSAFVYGLTTAASLVRSGAHRKVLVVGADTMSRIIDYQDRATCVLFGDGAGAFLVEATEEEGLGFVAHHNEIDGSGGEALQMPAGGSRLPSSCETVEKRLHYVKQDGQAVFKYAVRKMEEASLAVLEKAGVKPEEIKLMIPHQANMRIIRATAERLGLDESRYMLNIDRYGNTTAGTIPLATADAVAEGRLEKGDLVLFVSVGAGFTVGANLWRWGI